MADEDAVHDLLDELAQLAADLGPVLRPQSDEELLQSIVDVVRLVFDAAACSIALLNTEEDELEFRVAAGAGAQAAVGIRIPADRGIAGWALTSGQAIAIDDLHEDPRFAADVAESTGYVPTSILAMPLESGQQSFGVIEVLDRRQGGGEGGDDMELLGLFARQATLAVEASRTFSRLGEALFHSAARAVREGDLRSALEDRAAAAPRPQAELAQLALLFHDVGHLGADERLVAARIVNDFLGYARRRRR